MTKMTHSKTIVELLRDRLGLDDDEISRLTGIKPRQQVNQICLRLERNGKLKRDGSGRKIVNSLIEDER